VVGRFELCVLWCRVVWLLNCLSESKSSLRAVKSAV
jgi:hypothetical protein